MYDSAKLYERVREIRARRNRIDEPEAIAAAEVAEDEFGYMDYILRLIPGGHNGMRSMPRRPMNLGSGGRQHHKPQEVKFNGRQADIQTLADGSTVLVYRTIEKVNGRNIVKAETVRV